MNKSGWRGRRLTRSKLFQEYGRNSRATWRPGTTNEVRHSWREEEKSLCNTARERLEDHLELLRCHYNFVRPHRALKFGREVRTPARQAGLTSRALSLREIFSSKLLLWFRRMSYSRCWKPLGWSISLVPGSASGGLATIGDGSTELEPAHQQLMTEAPSSAISSIAFC